MKIHVLDTLKKMVISARDLSDPLNYFFDLMDHNQIITLDGHRKIKQPYKSELAMILKMVSFYLSQKQQKPVRVHKSILYTVARFNFFHGLIFLSESREPITMIYFSDIQIGIIVYVLPHSTEMFRITLADKKDCIKMH